MLLRKKIEVILLEKSIKSDYFVKICLIKLKQNNIIKKKNLEIMEIIHLKKTENDSLYNYKQIMKSYLHTKINITYHKK